ncbi:MAG: phage terminase small subunit [Clostridium botulinum]|nr:phage terminase small subunit [Clostridium botulinum]
MENIRGTDTKKQAKQDYLEGMKYKDLAEKYSVSLNTIKSWVKRYGWSEEKKQKGAHKNKKGAPLNNKNAVGHGAPAKNKNAEKHGFFSKYLPEDTLEIMEQIEQKTPLDMLWDQITIQYAAIIRAQRIMHVESKEEMIKELKKEEYSSFEGGYSEKKEYEFQFAWDRQATFLNAQSRAISELRSLVKNYLELEGLDKEKSKAGIKDWKSAIQEIAKRREKKKQSEVNSNG